MYHCFNTKNTEIFAFITVLVFKLLSRKFLFINRKDIGNIKKYATFFKKQQISRVNYCKIRKSWNANFSGYFYQCFFNLHDCTFVEVKTEGYLGPCQTSTIELFRENC